MFNKSHSGNVALSVHLLEWRRNAKRFRSSEQKLPSFNGFHASFGKYLVVSRPYYHKMHDKLPSKIVLHVNLCEATEAVELAWPISSWEEYGERNIQEIFWKWTWRAASTCRCSSSWLCWPDLEKETSVKFTLSKSVVWVSTFLVTEK